MKKAVYTFYSAIILVAILFGSTTKSFANETEGCKACGVQITTLSLPDATAGTPYGEIIMTSHAIGAVTFSVFTGNLPAGLSLDAGTGEISGTPATAGDNQTFTIHVQDQAHTASATYTLTVDGECNLSITTDSLPDAHVGGSYSQTISYSGQAESVTFSFDEGLLPMGMNFDVNTGTITGVPFSTGTYPFTVRINSEDCSATQDLVLKVTNCNLTATLNDFTPVCSNNERMILTGGMPEGGIYSGTGVTNGMFQPSAGTQTITYTFTDDNNCTASADKVLTVNTAPIVTLNDFLPVCSNVETIVLTGGSPQNGSYNGTGVTDGMFNPAMGTQTITYTITDNNNCTADASKVITVNMVPEVTLQDFTPTCNNADPITLSGGAPLNGTYSGTGVSQGMFDPTIGTQTITYSYTDNNMCASQVSKVMTVNAAPTVTLDNFTPICNNVGTITLSGGLPAGGTYTGAGVSFNRFNPVAGSQTITYTYTNGNCSAGISKLLVVNTSPVVSLSTFSTAVCSNAGEVPLSGGIPLGGVYAGVNVKSGVSSFNPKDGAQLITYTYTDNNLCSANASSTFPVNMAPAVSLAPLAAVCENAGTVSLTGGFPNGGVYTGTGVTNGIFDPSVGTQTIAYAFTDNNTCTSNSTKQLVVNPAPTVTLQTFTAMCSNEGLVTLSGGLPLGGTYSGTGVTGGQFDPSAGTQTITYTFTNDNVCTSRDTKQFVIKTAPTVTLQAFTPVCSNDEPVILTGGAPSGGMYDGTGVDGGKFNPEAGTQTIMYTLYSDENGCSSIAMRELVVNTAPTVLLEDFAPICSNATPVTLTGASPQGGTYTVSGNAATTFDPTGGTRNVRYTYTTNDGCTASVSKTYTVNTAPTVTLEDFTPVCTNSGPVALRGGLPAGGDYSGTNVASNMFDPAAGSEVITYTYTDNNSCTAKENKIMTVKVAPTVSLAEFTTTVCSNAGTVELNGGYPSGGVYSGTGVAAGMFDPTSGTQTISYIYSANNGCTAIDSKVFNVNMAPEVTLAAFAPLCNGTGTTELNGGMPSGGVYTGTGVAAGMFNPSAGTQTITYIYTDNNSNCTSSASQLQAVEVCNGVEEIAADVVRCFPNPTTGIVTVNITKVNKGNLDIRLMDMTGKVIATDEQGNATGTHQTIFDLSRLATGMYMVQITNGNTFSTQKVVKQ